MGNWFVWKITAGIVRVNWPRASQSWWHSSPSTFSPPLGEPNKIYECDFATRPCISGACKEIAKAWIRSHRSSGSLICSLQWILDLPVVHLDRPFKLKIPEPLHELIEWCVVVFARIFDKKVPVFLQKWARMKNWAHWSWPPPGGVHLLIWICKWNMDGWEGIGRAAINATLNIFRFIELGTRKAENIPLQLFPTHSFGVGWMKRQYW